MEQGESKECSVTDGPYCINLHQLTYRHSSNEDGYLFKLAQTRTKLVEEADKLMKLAKKEKEGGRALTQGIVLGERTYSFILTFQTYNNATNGSSKGIIVDKIIESIFDNNRKIVVDFERPVILTQAEK